MTIGLQTRETLSTVRFPCPALSVDDRRWPMSAWGDGGGRGDGCMYAWGQGMKRMAGRVMF